MPQQPDFSFQVPFPDRSLERSTLFTLPGYQKSHVITMAEHFGGRLDQVLSTASGGKGALLRR